MKVRDKVYHTKDVSLHGKGSLCPALYYTFFRHITRFFTFSFFLLLLSLNGFCQPGAEFGLIGGQGYYLGEYNRSHFKDSKMYIGGFYRYNLNDRFALRLNAGFSRIDIRNRPLPDNNGQAYPSGFKTSVKDICGLIEFNFRSFMAPKIEKSSLWAPYIFTGVGFLGAGDSGGVSIPFGVGVKFNLYRGFSCGIEWGGRKLFTDKLDGVEDPWHTGESNFLYNKDWFFMGGVTISWRIPMNVECFGYQ